jgi:hypothetical protein
MRSSSWTLSALAVVATLIVPPPAAQAQKQSSPPPASPGASTPSPNISDKKLDAAAAAVKDVATIRHDYEQKLSQASSAEQDRLVKEAETAMEKAVTNQGLSVEEYTEILRTAQNDRAVHDKIIQRLK